MQNTTAFWLVGALAFFLGSSLIERIFLSAPTFRFQEHYCYGEGNDSDVCRERFTYFVYTPIVERQEVTVYQNFGVGLSAFQDCTVADNDNWICYDPLNYDTFGQREGEWFGERFLGKENMSKFMWTTKQWLYTTILNKL